VEEQQILVAHRAGNQLSELRRAEDAGADLVELDVHLRRGQLEVRHLKGAWPLPLLWDRWELRRRSSPLLLADVFRAADEDTELMLDLKGFDPRMAGAVSRAIAEDGRQRRLAICSRDWGTADRVVAEATLRRIYSVGSRLQLAALRRRLRRRPPAAISIHRKLLDAGVVDELRAVVPLVLTWPVVSTHDVSRLGALGVNGFICRDLGVLTACRGGEGQMLAGVAG
jgi:glycerophosphoryl diester phosphodiesterase